MSQSSILPSEVMNYYEQVQEANRRLRIGSQVTCPIRASASRSTQRERDRLFGGHMPTFRPFQFKHDIPEPSA